MAGIVYHANYLKYIERARSEMVREAGIDQAEMRAEGRVFVVARIEADYLRPAFYDDDLMVETEARAFRPARFTMRQEVQRGETVLFRAEVTVALTDLRGRPQRLGPEIATLFARS
ncbi:acyl-CoA thioester hydrolase [Jannaschia seohaensis]|uniref:Acyl-CoA thioester hydrolase n=2 Tax=Jannaschia seohaensis TaxID=475081 RepID=A0A2Y9A2V5_9RHOB|nr:acyl-CoA thioester hydrolase [Jannaschia seohaensis]SSA38800.1 acyl-CoA thioester hydrolase [Jannaschia seohaensis]